MNDDTRNFNTVLFIPSRTDGCKLQVHLALPSTALARKQVYVGVIIAHPYGPLGGSYHNNVVGAIRRWFESHPFKVVDEGSSLDLSPSGKDATNKSKRSSTASTLASDSKSSSVSCIVCAFNFRGCGKSGGRTSWFGEAEREDYQTIVDFLQNCSCPNDSSASESEARAKVHKMEPPLLPFISRFVLCGYSYGGMIASTIPPPLRNPSDPSSGRLPTTYILVSYPAGVAWFLTKGMQGSFYKRACAILLGQAHDSSLSSSSSPSSSSQAESSAKESDKFMNKAYFITGAQDQFTSPKTLLTWLKNAGLDPPKQPKQPVSSASWSVGRPDGAIHLDVIKDVDHFWLDHEVDLLNKLKSWWSEAHPMMPLR